MINSVCQARLFTRTDLDQASQTGSSGVMEGPEPRRENPVLFHKHLVEKKSLTTKEALCLGLFQLRVPARTDPLRAWVRWKEGKRKGSFIWLTTSTNQHGGRMCVIWLCLFCIRILNMLGLLHHTSKDQREGDGRETRRRENHGFWWARFWATSNASQRDGGFGKAQWKKY